MSYKNFKQLVMTKEREKETNTGNGPQNLKRREGEVKGPGGKTIKISEITHLQMLLVSGTASVTDPC